MVAVITDVPSSGEYNMEVEFASIQPEEKEPQEVMSAPERSDESAPTSSTCGTVSRVFSGNQESMSVQNTV